MKAKQYNFTFLSCIDADGRDLLCKVLPDQGFQVFEIKAEPIGIAAIFQEMRTLLPLDPPISGRLSWDALADSLWEGLSLLGKEKVAIIFHNADILARADLTNLLQLVNTLVSRVIDLSKYELAKLRRQSARWSAGCHRRI